jgi:hypothetical protein
MPKQGRFQKLKDEKLPNALKLPSPQIQPWEMLKFYIIVHA